MKTREGLENSYIFLNIFCLNAIMYATSNKVSLFKLFAT